MYDSSMHDSTPLLSRRFITTTHRSGPALCSPRIFLATLRGTILEFMAMTFLMFVSAFCMRDIGTTCSNNAESSPDDTNDGGSILLVAIGNGFSYGVLVAATMHISGGYLNPAIALGVVIGGALHPISALCYVCAQILGAIAGAAIVRLHSETAVNSAVSHLNKLPGKEDIDAGTVLLAIMYEMITTSLLMMVVLHTVVDKLSKVKSAAPIIIGFSVVVGILSTYSFTGGSLNPARSIGPAIMGTSDGRWDYHYIYWIGPLLGATITSLLYRLLFSWKPWLPVYKHPTDEEEEHKTTIN